jgi:hypothetical protein
MKTVKIIISIMMIFCLFILLSSIAEFLVMNDIMKEYVSPYVIDQYKISCKNELPYWATYTNAWNGIFSILYMRFFISILNIIGLIYVIRKVKGIKKVAENKKLV